MNAIILHEARMLDPLAINGYAQAADLFRQANDAGIHGPELCYQDDSSGFLGGHLPLLVAKEGQRQFSLQESRSPQNPFKYSELLTAGQFERIRNRYEVSRLVYLAAIRLLAYLGIEEVRSLKDESDNRKFSGVYELRDLLDHALLMPNSQFSFKSKIEYPTALGVYRVGVRVNPLAGVNSKMEDGASDNGAKRHRAVAMTARFTDPNLAVPGLRILGANSSDALFEEKLLIGNLPERIVKMYKTIDAVLDAYWDYADGLTSKQLDLDEARYREMTSEAATAHIEFLKPAFKRLGIQPHRVDYYDDRSSMHYPIGVESLDDVIWLISRGYYDGSHIPLVHAIFNGQEIAIEFPPWEHGLGSNFAMQVRNGSDSHTLESLLAGIQSSFSKG